MRIRSLFLIGFCLVTAPSILGCLWFAGQAWHGMRDASGAILAMRTVSDAQRAQFAVALEFGTMGPSLLAKEVDLASFAPLASETDRLLGRVSESTAAAGLDAQPARDLARTAATLRKNVMTALAQPVAQRDASLRTAALTLRNGGADTLNRLAETASHQVIRQAPEIALLIEIANTTTILRDTVGRRNGSFVAWIGGAPVTAEGIELVQMLTSRAALGWESLERLVLAVPENGRLSQALEAQRASYLGRTEPRWQAALKPAQQALASHAAATWPEDVGQWRAWASPAQVAILDLRDAALDEALARTEASERAAILRFAIALSMTFLILGLTVASVIVLLRRLVLPLQRLTGTVSEIAGGRLDIAVPGRERTDELGEMAQAVETLRQGSQERLALAAARQEAQATELARAKRVDELLNRFEEETAGVLHVVASAATELDTTAAGMSDIADNGTRRANAVASASGQASESVQAVAAATEELTVSISKVAHQMHDSAGQATAAAAAVERAETTVHSLSEAATRIGDVVQLINQIAGQTNLLALNATIEAARAGESGKGFAVVASEVKLLASQTAKATQEIGQQIGAMQAETNRTVEAIATITTIIDELNKAAGLVAEAASQQAEATQEIGRAVAQAAQGTDAASRHAAGVSEDAERTGQAAGEVQAASGELARRTESLRAQMESFLTALRAA
ncbi:MAG TPA: methyl-accepting chemotaxis protein [Stellaceae bacterium]|nr:methyl-accepting chemotaxis protein [Stellaceae bacterium]